MFCEHDMIDICRLGHENIYLSLFGQIILFGTHFILMLKLLWLYYLKITIRIKSKLLCKDSRKTVFINLSLLRITLVFIKVCAWIIDK